MTFGQLKEYSKRNIFRNHAENKAGRLVPDLFCFLEKLYMKSAALFQYLSIALNLAYNKNNLYEMLDY